MSVLGVRCCGFIPSVEGIGCVILEWRDEVRLGMIKALSPWSRVSLVLGRPSRSPVRGLVKEEWALREGGMLTLVVRMSSQRFSKFCLGVQRPQSRSKTVLDQDSSRKEAPAARGSSYERPRLMKMQTSHQGLLRDVDSFRSNSLKPIDVLY